MSERDYRIEVRAWPVTVNLEPAIARYLATAPDQAMDDARSFAVCDEGSLRLVEVVNWRGQVIASFLPRWMYADG